MDEHTTQLQERVKTAPTETGVYLMKDAAGKVIYVGKAKNLRSRVRSYFANKDTRPMIPFMVPKIHHIDFIVTVTEKEALILENTMIKEHRPKYNVYFRDDKDYNHLRIDMDHPFPRFQFIRRPKKDGAVYFGPYSSGLAVKETMHFLQKIFPLRTCKDVLFRSRQRPCIEYEIKRCLGPCCNLVTREKYTDMVRDAVTFLEGKEKSLVRDLKDRMKAASSHYEFEEAARLRDIISSIEATLEKQNVFSMDFKDLDVFGIYREGNRTQACLVRIRKERIQGTKKFPAFKIDAPTGEILSSLLKQFYAEEDNIPVEIIIPDAIEDRAVIAEWLSEKKGSKVSLILPRRGKKRELMEMAVNNAGSMLKADSDSERKAGEIGEALAVNLHLKKVPKRIECFDISNIGGDQAVGSMVTFINGNPDKNEYRRFRIRDLQGANDFGMIYEVIKRRLAGKQELPDLMIVDGGKGQLNSAMLAIRESGVQGRESMDIIGLAKAADEPEQAGAQDIDAAGPKAKKVHKGEDRAYIAGRKDPVYLNKHPKALLFLQRIRDEAHRFAITYHRLLMRKRDIQSILDEIPGIGPARKKALLAGFQDINALKGASVEEIAGVDGITTELAHAIKDYLSDEHNTEVTPAE